MMISSLQPHLVLALTGLWAETVLAVAALAGMGYAWRWSHRPGAVDSQPGESRREAAERSWTAALGEASKRSRDLPAIPGYPPLQEPPP